MPEQDEDRKEKERGAETDVDACEECRTAALVESFSICLVKNRFCQHALPFGHQFLCRHPHHMNFIVPRKKDK